MADPTGFEPAIFSVTGRRVRPGYTTGPHWGVPENRGIFGESRIRA